MIRYALQCDGGHGFVGVVAERQNAVHPAIGQSGGFVLGFFARAAGVKHQVVVQLGAGFANAPHHFVHEAR
jgi:hypothetical protein